MKKEIIRKLILEDLERMGQLGHSIDKQFDAEKIHQFRVQAKKTRALLRLVALQTGNTSLTFSRRVKELYRQAGAIRDYQLMHQETGGDIPVLAKWLENNTGVAQYRWQDYYKPKTFHRFAAKITDMIKSVETETVVKFFNQRCKEIKLAIADPEPEDEALHELRKLLKDMLYVAAFCEKHWPKACQRLERFPLAQLKSLSALAGNYNDHTNRIGFLYSFASIFPDTAVTAGFTQLLRTTIGEQQRLRKQLLGGLQQFVAGLPRR